MLTLIPQAAEDQLQKKRGAAEVSSSYEAESRGKRLQRPDDDEYGDPIFDEEDSDVEDEEEDLFWRDVAECAYDNRETVPVAESEKIAEKSVGFGARMCLRREVCSFHQHDAKFRGLGLFELLKVILKFNDKCCKDDGSVDGNLFGEIVTLHRSHLGLSGDRPRVDNDNPFPISYYSRGANDADTVRLGPDDEKKYVVLPLSGPTPRPPLADDNWSNLAIDFALRFNGEDIFDKKDRYTHYNRLLFGDGQQPRMVRLYAPPPLSAAVPWVVRDVLGDPARDRVLVCAKYAVYSGASWATVKVQMLKESVTSFHGVIMARPCILFSRIRLLAIQQGRSDNLRSIQRAPTGEVDGNHTIKLTRSVVVVPSNSSLIIGAELYDGKDSQLICRGKTCFPAKESGEATDDIYYKGARILRVSVTWECRDS